MKKEARNKVEKGVRKTNRLFILLLCFILVFVVAGIGSIFTSGNVNSAWYQSIKPSITPPNFIFPIAWGILFFLIALSLFFAWTNSSKKEKKTISLLFTINFILNILWSFLFFFLKRPSLAFFEIIIFWISILVMIISLWKISKLASWLLLPYFIWVSFASILNYLSAF